MSLGWEPLAHIIRKEEGNKVIIIIIIIITSHKQAQESLNLESEMEGNKKDIKKEGELGSYLGLEEGAQDKIGIRRSGFFIVRL